MDDTKKMLQAIINGQAAIKQELSAKIDNVERRVERLDQKVTGLDQKLDTVEKNLTKRIDRLGKQIAYLEEDAPTREEFDNLKNRVNKIEKNTATSHT